MAQGAHRSAWISLLSPSVLETVSAEGRQRAEDLARMRVVPQRWLPAEAGSPGVRPL